MSKANNEKLDGKDIECICWPGEDGAELRATASIRLIAQYSYHGDHDELWILQIENGEEVARWNAKYLEGIIWKKKGE